MGSASHHRSEKATDEDGEVDGRLALIRAGVLGLVFVLATCGNFFFLGALWKKRKRNTKTQLFLLHLCLADLVVAFFQVLPQFLMEITHRFRGTDFMCRSVKYLQVVGMFASTYMIVAMTIDRYHAVCKPMVSFLKGSFRRYLSIGAAWLISLAFSSPQISIFSLLEVEENQYDCWATFIEPWGSRVYVTWITLSVFALPAVIVLYCQMRICTTIYFNMKRKALQTGRAGTKGVSNAMLKTVKMTFVIIMTYTVCWSPFFVVQLWSAWSPSSAPTKGLSKSCLGGPHPLRTKDACNNLFNVTIGPHVELVINCAPQKVWRSAATFLTLYFLEIVDTFLYLSFSLTGPVFAIIMLLASLNSCTNPWIYLYYS